MLTYQKSYSFNQCDIIRYMEPLVIKTRSFSSDAADIIIHKISETIAARGRCILGLSGGNTPRSVYSEIAIKGKNVDWSKVFITFNDERCVPPEDKESNFRMANETILSKVPIPSENICRMQGELDPDVAAEKYENVLSKLANGSDILQHDLLLLGIGDDGHTASLFPGTEALSENIKLVTKNFVPKLNTYRITMTYRLINASRDICFLVNDPRKENIVQGILNGNGSYPATGVHARESLTWIIAD